MLKSLKSPAVRASVGTLVAGLMVASLLVVSAGIVAAQTSTTSINACYDNRSGAMRYLVSGQCTSKEKAVSWNQAGPAGPKGDTGAAGADGEAGPAGPAGPSGVSNLRPVSKFYSVQGGGIVNMLSARCDDDSHPGSKAISGGFAAGLGDLVAVQSYPGASNNEPGSWIVGIRTLDPGDNGGDYFVRVYALCADAAG